MTGIRHVLGPTWVCVDCISDKNIPDDEPQTTMLTVWHGYMVCVWHLQSRIDQFLREELAKTRPEGDIIDGQCQEREYGPNGFRRCQFVANHSDPHWFGKWE